MNVIVFCTGHERQRIDSMFLSLMRDKGVVIMATTKTFSADITAFQDASVPVVFIIMRSLLKENFKITLHTPTDILFSSDFPGGTERVKALACVGRQAQRQKRGS